jgi:hypothetical protein
MDKIKEFAELFLPERILEYFDYEDYTKENKVENVYGEVTIILTRKTEFPSFRLIIQSQV